MKDRFGRINNRYQDIGEFSLNELACLLTMIKDFPNDFPDTIPEWKEWLKEKSGEDVIHL